MTDPQLVALPPELQKIQQGWLALGREKDARARQDELYAREFAEPFARLFAKLPLHGAPKNMPRPQALVSVLGLSWQPVALMAAWCRPNRMLVLGTEESLSLMPGGEDILSVVARVAGLPRGGIQAVRVGDPGEADIYRAVRDLLRTRNLAPREVFVDPTGGKKSMSAAAALAGFLAGAPLVYVDYGKYDESGRIPLAGTEYPRLLVNPLEVLGDLELRDILASFNRSDFLEAKHLAERLADRLYEPREAQCLAKLAQGYDAWDRFNFRDARQAVGESLDVLERFAKLGRWAWASPVRASLERNVVALDALVRVTERPDRIEDGVPLLVWYLAKARRMLDAAQPSLAVLLTYAAVERHVGLCLWIDFQLDDEKPDYSLVTQQLDMRKYHEAGRRFFGDGYQPREPAGPLLFSSGVQLLAVLRPERLEMTDLGPLIGLSHSRNKCEYEHGFLPQVPSRDDVERYLGKAHEIVSRACGGKERLEILLEDYRFPKLEARPRG